MGVMFFSNFMLVNCSICCWCVSCIRMYSVISLVMINRNRKNYECVKLDSVIGFSNGNVIIDLLLVFC